MNLLHGEIIKDIPGYENLYAATTLGRIWSYPSNSNVNRNGLWLKPNTNYKGYNHVVLRKASGECVSVHKLVLSTFSPNKNKKSHTQINHINGVKNDNKLSNLEWCTPSENMLHAYSKLGRKVSDKCRETARKTIRKNGLPGKLRLLTMKQAESIRKEHCCRVDTRRLSEKYGVGMHVIRRIINRESYVENENPNNTPHSNR